MPITINGIDILQRIKGTYNTNMDASVGPIRGIIGMPPISPLCSPNPLGILYNGTDICSSYTAPYIEYFASINKVPIPVNVKSLTVECVGGGQAGFSAYNIWSPDNMYGLKGGQGLSGVRTISELVKTPSNTEYSIVIGQGGNGNAPDWPGYPGPNTEAEYGNPGSNTMFYYTTGGPIASFKGLGGGQDNNPPSSGITTGPGAGGLGGDPIASSDDLTKLVRDWIKPLYSYGKKGNPGYVRVYFKY